MAAQQNDTPKRRRRRFQYSLRTLLLFVLYLRDTQVTVAGVEELEKTLPDAEIEY